MIDPATFIAVAEVSVAAASVAGLLVGGYKMIVRPIRQGFRKLEVLAPAVAEIQATVSSLQKHIAPNSGASVTDALARIELRQLVSEEKHWMLHLDAPHGVFELTKDGDCKRINRTYSRITGRNQEDCLGSGWLLTIDEDERESVKDELDFAVEQEREFVKQYTVRLENNSTIQVTAIAYPLRDQIGNLQGYVGILSRRN